MMAERISSARRQQRRPSPRGLRALGLLAAAFAIVIGGCAAPADVVEPDVEEAIPVDVIEVERRDLARSLNWSGRLDAKQTVYVTAEVAGQVAEVHVEVGDQVAAGDLLVSLDADALQRQAQQAAAAVASARAALEDAKQAYEIAQREQARLKPLYELGAISRQQWESIQDDVERARHAVEETLPAQLAQAEAAYAAARLQIDNAEIRAPIAGEISAVQTSRGNYAAPGNPLIVLVQRDTLEVNALLSERQVAQIELGQDVQVRVPAVDAQAFAGAITAIAPAANEQGMFAVKVEIPNPELRLRPGMQAELEIPVEQAEAVPVVPAHALLQRNGQESVFVVEDDVAKLRPVTTGIRSEDLVAVVAGLAEGERVVVGGHSFLSDGTPVRVQHVRSYEREDAGGAGR